MSNIVSDIVIAKLSDPTLPPLDLYFEALKESCEASPPPFGEQWFGNNFRSHSVDANWFADLLSRDSYMEGYSAKQIYAYAHSVENQRIAESLKRHAMDEASHSKVFVRFLCMLFPQAMDEANLAIVKGYSPDLTQINFTHTDELKESMDNDSVLSTLVQINLFEIQALFLQFLLKPCVMAYCPKEHAGAAEALCNRLISDELNHIRYTANFIQEAADSGSKDLIFSGMKDFQNYLGDLTLSELTAAKMIGG